MPKFTKLDRETSAYRWSNFNDYEITSDTDNKIVLTYSEDRRGPFDPSVQAWQIHLVIANGDVVRVKYLDEKGDVLARITGTDADADLIRLLYDPDVNNSHHTYNLLLQGGGTFKGSSNNNGNSDLTTTPWDDVVRVGAGSSYIKDAGGSDLYVGNDDFNQITYDEWFWRDPAGATQGIQADLARGRIKGPDGEVDTLRGSFEGVRGTFLDDVMRGNSSDNEIMGFRGSDIINGRGGWDTVSYRNDVWQGADHGVTINLAKGFAKDSFGDRDKLISIEQAEGTDFQDKFVDGAGDHYFNGRAGDDKFIIKKGDDGMSGGDGADKFVFKGSDFGSNTIYDFDPLEGDRIKIATLDSISDLDDIFQDGREGVIQLANGNQIRLTDFNVDGVDMNDYILF